MSAGAGSAEGEMLWADGGVRCAMIPVQAGTAVELRNEQGIPFLRKHAPTITAARNEAEYLRLLLKRQSHGPVPSGLMPFALIVEDEPDTADAYREGLRLNGVRALCVRTAREALRHATELVPDLVILDFRLPDGHGTEVCSRLRNMPATARIPILVVTASPQDATPCGERVDAVLTKPVLLPTLLAASRLLLSRVLPPATRGASSRR